MKSQYIILDKNYTLRALIDNKETLDLFTSQRNMENFLVEKTKNEKVIEYLNSECKLVEIAYGVVMFPEEYEYMMLSFDQFFIDMHCRLKDLYKDLSGYLKLDDDEGKLVIEFIVMMIKHIEEYNAAQEVELEAEESIIIEDKYFNMKKFAFSAM